MDKQGALPNIAHIADFSLKAPSEQSSAQIQLRVVLKIFRELELRPMFIKEVTEAERLISFPNPHTSYLQVTNREISYLSKTLGCLAKVLGGSCSWIQDSDLVPKN